MRAIAYIDAFNFYYGLTKDTPYKWCDLPKLCSILLPGANILKIKMFTGRSKAIDDERQPERQAVYLRALEYYGVEIHRSVFDVRIKRLRTNFLNIPVNVKSPQEKGSDVKLATHLIIDAYLDLYDVGILITNDSDLVEPILKVKEVFKKDIYVFAPARPPCKRVSAKLRDACGKDNHIVIPFELLPQCQLPDHIERKRGKALNKPDKWKASY
jgi:uncharacterized LabA/DUF88 family protein